MSQTSYQKCDFCGRQEKLTYDNKDKTREWFKVTNLTGTIQAADMCTDCFDKYANLEVKRPETTP